MLYEQGLDVILSNPYHTKVIAAYHAKKTDTTVYSAGEIGYEYKLSVDFINETSIIDSIMEKALASISEQRKEIMLTEIIQ